MTSTHDAGPLIKAIVRLYESDGTAIAMLAAAARRLSAHRARALQAEGAPQLPVCRHLASLTRAKTDPAVAEIRDRFLALAPAWRWRQNPNYVADPPDPGFLADYGYVELIGPAGHIADQQLAVGFLLLGPSVDYPEHFHPAEEVYHPITGVAEWWRDGSTRVAVAPGSTIHHPSMLGHSTRTGRTPLLALYCWQGEILTAARIGKPPASTGKAKARRGAGLA
jgi:hypothetical protein